MTKKEQYEQLVPQVASLVKGEGCRMSVMANVAAALKAAMDFFWVGFYVVDDGELKLGPFQGSVACMHIAFGRGVCGTAWQQEKTIVVEDVELFPGHIACSSLSRSEIVVPLKDEEGKVWGVLDIDSTELGDFDQTDQYYLEQIAALLK